MRPALTTSLEGELAKDVIEDFRRKFFDLNFASGPCRLWRACIWVRKFRGGTHEEAAHLRDENRPDAELPTLLGR